MKKKTAGRSPEKRRRTTRLPSIAGPLIISGDNIVIKRVDPERAVTAHLVVGHFPTLQELERDYINKVLSHANHNRTKAAEILGIDRVSLWRKIKKYQTATRPCRPDG